MILERYCNL